VWIGAAFLDLLAAAGALFEAEGAPLRAPLSVWIGVVAALMWMGAGVLDLLALWTPPCRARRRLDDAVEVHERSPLGDSDDERGVGAV
jgi:hypothetical protein